MEKLWSPKTLGTMSGLWLIVRLAFIALSIYYLGFSCDAKIRLFLQLLLYSTIISVFFQIIVFALNVLALLGGLTVRCKQKVSLITYIFFALDYGIYGLFRFVVVIAGAVWLGQEENCDQEVYAFCMVVIIGYFVVFWGVCWIGCLTVCSLLWDTYTL